MTAGRLLILDDDVAVAETMGAIARRSGYETRSATDANSFFGLLDRWDPTHILLDLVMPDVDGIEIMRRLAELRCRSIVILTSGVGVRVLDAAERAATEHGLHVVGSLSKPFPPAKLRALLGSEQPPGVPVATLGGSQIEVTEDALVHALEVNRIDVHFQPQIFCATGDLAGFETLARWHHPEAGLVPPDRFIPLAEQSGHIVRLTDRVAELAFDWLRSAWPDGGPQLSINLSARALADSDLVNRLADLCARHAIDPARVIVELTETSAMSDPVTTLDLLTQLRIKGFRLSIDDFGVGFSSLVQLARLPFSEIKIDRSFVMHAAGSDEARIIIRTIISLGHNLGLRVVAEGVEDAVALNFLRENGCDCAQGYFIARPMTGSAAREWTPPRR